MIAVTVPLYHDTKDEYRTAYVIINLGWSFCYFYFTIIFLQFSLLNFPAYYTAFLYKLSLQLKSHCSTRGITTIILS
jgi:hypothetical protein